MSGGGGGGDLENSHSHLLRSNSSNYSEAADLESQRAKRKGITDLLKQLDRGFSSRRLNSSSSSKHGGPSASASSSSVVDHDTLADGAPPEWALLLIGCLLGLATGVCVATFNRGVPLIHEWAWAGTPNEGAAWLCL